MTPKTGIEVAVEAERSEAEFPFLHHFQSQERIPLESADSKGAGIAVKLVGCRPCYVWIENGQTEEGELVELVVSAQAVSPYEKGKFGSVVVIQEFCACRVAQIDRYFF